MRGLEFGLLSLMNQTNTSQSPLIHFVPNSSFGVALSSWAVVCRAPSNAHVKLTQPLPSLQPQLTPCLVDSSGRDLIISCVMITQ